MSSKAISRQITIKATDSTTSTLLAVARTARSVSREIHFLQMAFDILAESELTAATAAQLAIPIIGIFAAAVSMYAGARMIQARSGVIPVGQTQPGEYRVATGTGPMIIDKGEVISRPMQGSGPGSGGGTTTINMYDTRISRNVDAEEFLGELSLFLDRRRYGGP